MHSWIPWREENRFALKTNGSYKEVLSLHRGQDERGAESRVLKTGRSDFKSNTTAYCSWNLGLGLFLLSVSFLTCKVGHEESMNSTDLKSDSLGSVCHSPSTYYLSKLLHRAYVWNGYGPQSVGLLWSLDMVAPINPLRRLPDTCSQRLRGIIINQLPWQLVKPNKWVEITKASWLS